MITCHTTKFNNLRKTQCKNTIKTLDCNDIAKNIEEMSENIVNFESILQKNSLPTFSSNEANTKRAETLRNLIEEQNIHIKNTILTFIENINHRIIKENILNYFTVLLEKQIVFFKRIITNNMTNTSSFDILQDVANENINKNYNMFNLQQEQLHTNSNTLVTQSLMSITNTLLEMKMNLKEQSIAIDSLDRYFENTNRYIDMANCEIKKLPKSMFGLKDKLIKLLLFFVVVLGTAIILKNNHVNIRELIKNHSKLNSMPYKTEVNLNIESKPDSTSNISNDNNDSENEMSDTKDESENDEGDVTN